MPTIDPKYIAAQGKVKDAVGALTSLEGQLNNMKKRVPLSDEECKKCIKAAIKVSKGEIDMKKYIETTNASIASMTALKHYCQDYVHYYDHYVAKRPVSVG